MKIHKKGRPITVHSSQCTGCLMCELRCSFRFEQAFNPSKARIKVLRASNGEGFDISFTDECDNCGLCARLCPYDALIQESKA
ncbi:4Fe-4S binding protein [Chloroflexota bacterium]